MRPRARGPASSQQANDENHRDQFFYGVAARPAGGFVAVGSGSGDVDFGDGQPVESPTSMPLPNVLAVAYAADGKSILWKQIYGGSMTNPDQSPAPSPWPRGATSS